MKKKKGTTTNKKKLNKMEKPVASRTQKESWVVYIRTNMPVRSCFYPQKPTINYDVPTKMAALQQWRSLTSHMARARTSHAITHCHESQSKEFSFVYKTLMGNPAWSVASHLYGVKHPQIFKVGAKI